MKHNDQLHAHITSESTVDEWCGRQAIGTGGVPMALLDELGRRLRHQSNRLMAKCNELGEDYEDTFGWAYCRGKLDGLNYAKIMLVGVIQETWQREVTKPSTEPSA